MSNSSVKFLPSAVHCPLAAAAAAVAASTPAWYALKPGCAEAAVAMAAAAAVVAVDVAIDDDGDLQRIENFKIDFR